MFSLLFNLLECRFSRYISLIHQISCYYSGTAWYSCLTMNKNIGLWYVFRNKFVRTVKKTFYILSGVVWNQDTEMFGIGVDKETFFSKYWDDCTDMIFFKLFLVLCNFDIPQCQSSKKMMFMPLGFYNPIKIISKKRLFDNIPLMLRLLLCFGIHRSKSHNSICLMI